VIGAAYDLEEALFQVHPAASCAAVATFWKSWQIEQHVTSFCARLVTSETARALVAGDPAGMSSAPDGLSLASWLHLQRSSVPQRARRPVPRTKSPAIHRRILRASRRQARPTFHGVR
jgi:hypothetical protein